MTRLLPVPVLPPACADLGSAALTQRTTRSPAMDGVGDLSLTVIVEENAQRSARRFAFRASRQEEPPSDRPSRDAPLPGQDLLTADHRTMSATILDRPELHDSARFLAGAIAQARPGTMLHNPPYREATIAYRRSDALGVRSSMPRAWSSKRI